MKYLSILFILILSLSAFGQTEEELPDLSDLAIKKPLSKSAWVFIASSDDTYHYYNPSRMSKSKGIVRVWTKSILTATQKVDSKIQFEIICATSKYRAIVGVTYGARTRTWETPKARFQTVIPESPIEALQIKVCK